MLVGLVALISEVLKSDRCLADLEAVAFTDPQDAGQYTFMNSLLEANPRVRTEQPQFMVGRIPNLWPESDIECCKTRGRYGFPQCGSGCWNKPLVGVDVKNPVGVYSVECAIARGREIPIPFVVEEASAMGRHDFRGFIDRACVDDNNLINMVTDRFQTSANHGGFVTHDQSSGYLQSAPKVGRKALGSASVAQLSHRFDVQASVHRERRHHRHRKGTDQEALDDFTARRWHLVQQAVKAVIGHCRLSP
ncbi:MAG: hypothetical protein NTV73_07685 [Hyphomicrobiales bacterium]|nr:hypothetical protein [Hyphomicrobiales bacterium]